jgi:hypothetical protein
MLTFLPFFSGLGLFFKEKQPSLFRGQIKSTTQKGGAFC